VEIKEITLYFGIPLVILVICAGIFFFGMWKRKRYEILAINHVIGEFWPETGGERYRVLLQKEANGKQVKAPAGDNHTIQYYSFDRGSTSQTKYPLAPPLNIPLLAFMQTSIPMISWKENDPEPINPYEHEPVATAEMIAIAQDEHYGALVMVAEEENLKLRGELIKALVTKLNKYIVYIALGLILSEGAAILYYLYGGLS